MITLSSTLTGNQIGAALAGDPEELAYCLVALTDELRLDDIPEVAEHVMNAHLVGPFLRVLADAIHPEKDQENE